MYFFTHFLIYLDRTEQILGGQVFRVFLVIHCMGWVSQFIGHGVYEQRAPALLTNALFAFIFIALIYFNEFHIKKVN